MSGDSGVNVQCSCCDRRAAVAWKRVPLCGDHGLEVARRLSRSQLRDVSAEDIARVSGEIGQELSASNQTSEPAGR